MFKQSMVYKLTGCWLTGTSITMDNLLTFKENCVRLEGQ